MPEAAEAAPVRQANTEARYDRTATPVVNAKDDARAIEQDITRGDASAALTRFQLETGDRGLQGASQQQRTEYMSALNDQLTRDGVLPALQIAAVQREGAAVKKPNGEIDLAKINERAAALRETNPTASMLLSGYAREQEALRRPGSGALTDGYLSMQLDRQLGASRDAIRDNRAREAVSPLVTNPQLFDAIAGRGRNGANDKRIEQADLDKFRSDWGFGVPPERLTDSQRALRSQFGTQEQQNKIDKFLKDNPTVDNAQNRSAGLIERNWIDNNAFTRETLTRGLGGEEAVRRLQTEAAQRPNGTPPREVTAATPEASTLRDGEGPSQVTRRILQGSEFADPAKAQRDLQGAIGRNFIDRSGADQLGGENRAKVREDIRKGGNTELLNWFDKRYPTTDTTAPAASNQEAKDKQIRDNISPLTDPKLFGAIAGLGRGVKDDRIEQRDLDAFKEKWGDGSKPEHQQFRAQFGTQEQQNRIDKFLKDNPTIDSADNRRLGLVERNLLAPNAITRDTLTAGLGGAEAVRNYQQQAQRRPDGSTPRDVTPAGPETSTLRNGEGPHQVARRMLQGQEFADPAKAQRDLQAALGRNFIDRSGTDQLGGENRAKVRESIRQSNNTELLNWFDKRYPAPKPTDAAPAQQNRVTADTDYSRTRVIPGRGAEAVSRQMLEGQGLDEGSRAALQRVLQSPELGINWRGVQAGKPIIGDADKPGVVDVEKFRQTVNKSGNEALKTWFNARYPEKRPAAAVVPNPIESTWIMAP